MAELAADPLEQLPPTPASSLSWVQPGSPSLPANGTTAHLSGSRLAFLELGHVSGSASRSRGSPHTWKRIDFQTPSYQRLSSLKSDPSAGTGQKLPFHTSCPRGPPPTLQKSCTCFTFLDLSNRQGIKLSGRGEEEPIKHTSVRDESPIWVTTAFVSQVISKSLL